MSITWTETHSLKLSCLLVRIIMVLALVALFFIPLCTEWYDAVSEQEPIRLQLNICFYLCDAVAMVAIWQLDRMLFRIRRSQIFVPENVTTLRILSWACIAIGVILGVLTIWRTIMLLVMLVCLFLGVLLRVLKNVFAMAVALQEESDYTI